MPNYKDLFGSLDYCRCQDCNSIFSPAAYFFDLMRIVDEYITDPNTASIPPGCSLEQRRGDLFEIKLSCANINDQGPNPQIVNRSAHSEYLLIDVGMKGSETSSPIRRGIESVQLYMQRCRLGLEPGVSDLSKIPDVWWEWLSTYRKWEANRKIFLYPENYIDPTLRSNATPQFKEFADALLKAATEEDSVLRAFDRLGPQSAQGLNSWEIFFFAPFLVAYSLHSAGSFGKAAAWYGYIFNPFQQPEPDSTGDDRFWRFQPFRDMNFSSLTQIIADPAQIAACNSQPFDPDAIARLRSVSYAKAFFMHYLTNLLDWGDFPFAQDTQESIAEATDLYYLASEVLGPRPEVVGDCTAHQPMSFHEIRQEYNNKTVRSGTAKTGGVSSLTLAASDSSDSDAYTGMYLSITAGTGAGQTRSIVAYVGTTRVATVAEAWDQIPLATSQYRVFMNGIPEFLIRMENAPNSPDAADPGVAGSDLPFNDIDSYFSVPENTALTTYWDRVQDRLSKLRH